MKRFILLLLLLLVACNAQGTSFPPSSTPTTNLATQTSSAPTTLPGTEISETPAPSPAPPTGTAISTTTFPDPAAYQWQQLPVSGLERPLDLQPNGSGRLFVVEKEGRIRIIENDQL